MKNGIKVDLNNADTEPDDEMLEVPVEAGKETEVASGFGNITEQLYDSLNDLEDGEDVIIFEDEEEDEEDEYYDEEIDESELAEFAETEPEREIKKRKIVPIILGVAVVLLITGGILGAWLTSYDTIHDNIVLELGQEPSAEASDYIEASGFVESRASVDISEVDYMKVGSYRAIISALGKRTEVSIEVVDTTNPEVVLKAEIKGVVGKPISGDEIFKMVSDLAGIASIKFEQAQEEGAVIENKENEVGISSVFVKYDTVGIQQDVVTVIDNSGNETQLPLEIKIVEDYEAHVQGFEDLTVEKGNTEVNWLENITYDERVQEITVDDSKVDLNTVGEYELIYHIIGDDNETVVDKIVKVIIVEPSTQDTDVSSTAASEGAENNNRNSNTNRNNGQGTRREPGVNGGGNTNQNEGVEEPPAPPAGEPDSPEPDSPEPESPEPESPEGENPGNNEGEE